MFSSLVNTIQIKPLLILNQATRGRNRPVPGVESRLETLAPTCRVFSLPARLDLRSDVSEATSTGRLPDRKFVYKRLPEGALEELKNSILKTKVDAAKSDTINSCRRYWQPAFGETHRICDHAHENFRDIRRFQKSSRQGNAYPKGAANS